MVLRIDADRITSWDAFHEVFREALGFPGFYGRNMNAWIDCLTSLDEPADGMTSVHVKPPEVLTLHIDHAEAWAQRAPEMFRAMVDGAALVNWRRMEMGQPPVIGLAYTVR